MFGDYSTLIVVGLVLVAILLMVYSITRLYRRTPPDMAMIVSGRGNLPRIVVGSGTLVLPILETINTISLRNRPIVVEVTDVLTEDFVPVTVEAVAQLKVGNDDEQIRAASTRFLGMSDIDVHKTLHDTLGGHLRALIATMTAVAVSQDREGFAQKVLATSTPELARLGFTIDSFVIREIKDSHGYYESLGQGQIANARRDANMATAEADRETREKTAAANLAARQAEIGAETQEAEAAKDRDVATQGYRVDSEKARADADVAGPLQAAVRERELARTQGEAEVVRQQQAARAAAEAANVATSRQEAEVIVPAKAARTAAVETAEGEAAATRALAGAEAERITLTREAQATGIRAEGTAEADVTKARLLAEAEGERELAEARSSQGEVNFRRDALQLLAESRVKAAEAIGLAMGELGKGMRVVQFSGGNNEKGGNAVLNAVRGIPGLIAEANEGIDALFGVNFAELLRGRVSKANPEAVSTEPTVTTTRDIHSEVSVEPSSGINQT